MLGHCLSAVEFVPTASWVIFVAAFAYQAIRFTILYQSNPLKTTIETENINSTGYDELVICCKVNPCLYSEKNESMESLFAESYWHRPGTIESKEYPDVDSGKYSMRRLMRKWDVNSVSALMAAVSRMRRGKGPASGPTNFTVPLPHFKSGRRDALVCFKLALDKQWRPSDLLHPEKDDKMKYRKEFTLVVPKTRIRRHSSTVFLKISLYKGQQWPLASETVYSSYRHEFVDDRRTTAYFDVSIKKYSYVPTGQRPCTSVPVESRYPQGLARDMCAVQCDDEVSKSMFNCTWTAILIEGPADQPGNYCNMNVLYNEFVHVKAEYYKQVEKCITRNQCRTTRFCTEWEIGLKFRDKKHPRGSKGIFNIVVRLPTIMMTVSEDYALTFEQWIGNTGGLFGMYLGLSFVGMVGFLYKLCRKSCSKKVTNEKLSEA